MDTKVLLGRGEAKATADMECGGIDAALGVRETTKTTKFPGRIGNHKGHDGHEGFINTEFLFPWNTQHSCFG
jgi:hypothetical protein